MEHDPDLLAQLVIDPDDLFTHIGRHRLGSRKNVTRRIRQRQSPRRQEGLGIGIDQRAGNPVAREGLPRCEATGEESRSCCRVVRVRNLDATYRTKIAVPQRLWHRIDENRVPRSGADAPPFLIEKEKGLLLGNGAADVVPESVVFQRRFGAAGFVGKEGSGIQRVVAQKLPGRSMEIVRPGLDCHDGGSA